MKKIFLTLMIISFSFMQSNNPMNKRAFKDWNNETKALYYQAERISPEKALFYQMSLNFIPFSNLGYAYSDNWKRGFKWDLAIIGAVVLSNINYEEEECNYNYGSMNTFYSCNDPNNDTSDILLLAAFGMGIYKLVDVYKTAEKYNSKLFKRLFGGKKPTFAMNYSFSNNSPEISFNIPLN